MFSPPYHKGLLLLVPPPLLAHEVLFLLYRVMTKNKKVTAAYMQHGVIMS